MAGNPELQNVSAASPPDSVTPHDSPGNPAGFAMVTPHGLGPAPYDIQALDGVQGPIEAQFNAANALAGAGVLYAQGPRQRAAENLMESPQGFNSGTGLTGYDIPYGWAGEPDESFPSNVQPNAVLETPIQGQSSYPTSNTYQDGVPKYGC